MPIRQQIMSFLVSFCIIVVIIELVRRRKLREEYSLLWIITGATLMVLGLWHGLLVYITRFIGAVVPTSTLFFLGLIFLILINLHASVKISKLKMEIKMLTQHFAMFEKDMESTILHMRENPGKLSG